MKKTKKQKKSVITRVGRAKKGDVPQLFRSFDVRAHPIPCTLALARVGGSLSIYGEFQWDSLILCLTHSFLLLLY